MARLVGARASRRATEAMVAMVTMATARSAWRMDLKEDLKGQRYQVASPFGSGLGVGLVNFLLEGIHNAAVTAALEVILEPLQGHADDIAVVEPRPDARLRAEP